MQVFLYLKSFQEYHIQGSLFTSRAGAHSFKIQFRTTYIVGATSFNNLNTHALMLPNVTRSVYII